MASPGRRSLDPVRGQLRAFLAGGPFGALWTAVMDAAAQIDDDATLADDERDAFDELYDFAYMAADDPAATPAAARARDDELREQLRELGLDRLGAPSRP